MDAIINLLFITHNYTNKVYIISFCIIKRVFTDKKHTIKTYYLWLMLIQMIVTRAHSTGSTEKCTTRTFHHLNLWKRIWLYFGLFAAYYMPLGIGCYVPCRVSIVKLKQTPQWRYVAMAQPMVAHRKTNCILLFLTLYLGEGLLAMGRPPGYRDVLTWSFTSLHT